MLKQVSSGIISLVTLTKREADILNLALLLLSPRVR